MRVSAVGYAARSKEEVIDLSRAVTEVTHSHPEGLKGAEVTAMCIFMCKNGATKEEVREYIYNMYPKVKTLDYEELRRTYIHGKEICQITVPEALYCFLISDSFEDCLRTTISIGGDCDTTSAISCAVAEAYYKHIPSDLVEQVRSKLPDDMLMVIERFKRKYGGN